MEKIKCKTSLSILTPFLSVFLLLFLKLTAVAAFRFHGLRVSTTSNSLWFYSVQGVFRVAFDMYSKQEQLAVLEKLQVQCTLHQLALSYFFCDLLHILIKICISFLRMFGNLRSVTNTWK